MPVLALVLVAASNLDPSPFIAASPLHAQRTRALCLCNFAFNNKSIRQFGACVPHRARSADPGPSPGCPGWACDVAVGLLLSCSGSPWGAAASGAPGSPGEKLPQGELGIPQATHPRHTKGVRFLAHPRYPLGIPTSVPEVSPGAPRFFAVEPSITSMQHVKH